MTVKERLKKFIEFKRISVRRFENSVGLSYGYVNNIRVSIQPDKVAVIGQVYPELNTGWLLTGEGEMLKKNTAEVTLTLPDHILLVPLVNQYAYAGFMSGYSDDIYMDELPKIPFLVDREYKGNYLCFEVKGDSMDDGTKRSMEAGDLLLGREIHPDYWKSKLHIKKWEAFIIAHKTEGIVVKQIIDHNVEEGIITCHSYNPIFEDFQLHLSEVIKLYNVVKILKNP